MRGVLPSGAPVRAHHPLLGARPTTGCTRPVDFSHGPHPQARPGGRRGRKRRAHLALRGAGGPASDAPHPHRRRGAARGLPLPAGARRARDRRPGPARHAPGRAGPLLRPAPRVLARRAPRHAGAPDLPGGVRAGVVQEPCARRGALGRRGPPRRDPRRQRARRRPGRPPRRLEPWRHLRPARRRRSAGPADRLAHRRRLPGRRDQGAAGRAGAPAAQPDPGHGGDHPRLPGPRRRADAAGQLGLHRRVRAEDRHQAPGGAHPSRRQRLPRPDGGGHPLHVGHDRLPGSDLRPALPPLHQGQHARRGPHGARRADHRPRGHHGPGPRLRRQHRRHRAAACRACRRRAAERLAPGAVRDRAGRPPRDAHRPRGPGHDVAGARRVGGGVVGGRGGCAAHEEGRREEGARHEGCREEGPCQEGPCRKKAAAKKPPARKASPGTIGSNPSRRYGSSGSRALGPK